MDPQALLPPTSPFGFPAPYWFLVAFKLIGFVLHASMMNLWYAGPVLALIFRLRGGHYRTLSNRFMKQMPIIVAYGVNFGIVPLLFIQVAYYKVFYPSTILMAWAWFSVVILLTFAYYGIYIYSTGLRGDENSMTSFKRLSGWVAAVLFIVIGFIFSNEFSLMTRLSAWHGLWKDQNVGGAVLGIALNTSDSTLWPRWLMMFGLAITTVSAYFAVDAGLFASKESVDYKSWAAKFAYKPYLLGMLWFAVMGSWYVFGSWPDDIRHFMLSPPRAALTFLTALSPGLTWLVLLFIARRRMVTRGLGLLAGSMQLLVLSFNAASRQVVQNAELARVADVTTEPLHIQWSPLILFLVSFAIGLGIIIWMIDKVAKAASGAAEQGR